MRLVTRSDFDGLVCAVLIKQVEQLDEIKFVHPKDLQDGDFEVRPDDIFANVPYMPGCGLWFDHHAIGTEARGGQEEFKGVCRLAPSAARVVYDYYGGAERFPGIEEMMREVDKADSAQFTREEILHPTGWPLLSFVMDARTGLGRFRDYRISNYQLMFELIDACTRMSIEEILQMPDVQERVVALLRAERAVSGHAAPTLVHQRQCGRHGFARRRPNPFRQPLPRLRAVPGAEYVHLDRQRQGQPELRVRLRPQHPQPNVANAHRRADARPRRRRTRSGGNLPGSPRGGGSHAAKPAGRDAQR